MAAMSLFTLKFCCLILALSQIIPEHLSPWCAMPWSIEPQWSQKVGVRNENTSHLCGTFTAWEQQSRRCTETFFFTRTSRWQMIFFYCSQWSSPNLTNLKFTLWVSLPSKLKRGFGWAWWKWEWVFRSSRIDLCSSASTKCRPFTSSRVAKLTLTLPM